MLQALLLAVAICVGLASAELRTLWSLPLGLGPTASGLVPFAADGGIVYTANTRGVLFAVDATTAELLWSSPGNDEVSQILLFPEVPDMLYVASYGLSQQVSVAAVRRSDGSVLGTLSNMTGAPPHMAISGRKRVALRHENGIVMADHTLSTVYWRRDPPPNTTSYFSLVGANADLVTTLLYPGGEWGRPASVLSFDAKSGEPLCNVSFVDMVLSDAGGSQIVLTSTNLSVGMFQGWADPPMNGSWRALDLGRCEAVRTVNINDEAVGSTITPLVLRLTPGQELFVTIASSGSNNGSFIISGSPLSVDSAPAWSTTVVDSLTLPLMYPWPMLGRALLESEEPSLTVWWGILATLNPSTGSMWTAASNRLPAASPCQGQFLFPLSANRLLLPNLQGYLILSSLSGDVDTVVLDDPIFATGAVAAVRNTTTRTPFAVYVSISGDLVAVD